MVNRKNLFLIIIAVPLICSASQDKQIIESKQAHLPQWRKHPCFTFEDAITYTDKNYFIALLEKYKKLPAYAQPSIRLSLKKNMQESLKDRSENIDNTLFKGLVTILVSGGCFLNDNILGTLLALGCAWMIGGPQIYFSFACARDGQDRYFKLAEMLKEFNDKYAEKKEQKKE